MDAPTETLVAELLRMRAYTYIGLTDMDTLAKVATTLTTQSALIETLTRERDEARGDANAWQLQCKDAEAALADARDKALEEARRVAIEYSTDETVPHSNRAVQCNVAQEIAANIAALKSA